MRVQRRDETGMALITVVLLSGIVVGLGILMITVALRTNENTQFQKIREHAFQAADAGVSDAISCLIKLTPTSFSSGVTACNSTLGTASSRTQLTDEDTNLGQYTVNITDITPASETDKIVQIESIGIAPEASADRFSAERRVVTQVRLEPVGGFLYTIFSGDPSGSIDIKNNATVNGPAYSRHVNFQKNNNFLGAIEVFGDFTTKNNDIYESIWSGGDVTLGNNTSVTLDVDVCGDPAAGKGNITLNNSASIGRDLTYLGTSSPSDPSSQVGGTINNPTDCPAPPARDLPAFSWDRNDYHSPNFDPSQTVLEFTDADAAHDCLAETRVSDQPDPGKCGDAQVYPSSRTATLGTADRRLGGEFGTVVYVQDSSCPSSPVLELEDNWVIENNFTLVTNCKVSVGGNWTYADDWASDATVMIYSSSDTGSADIESAQPDHLVSSDARIHLLLFTPGQIHAKNSITIGSGALYGGSILVNNNLNIGESAVLRDTPPPGFDFSGTAVRFTAEVTRWREVAS